MGNTLEAVAGGYMIERWSGGRETFANPLRVVKFVLVSVGPATVISATVGVVTLSVAGFAAWENFTPIWVTWWLGDAAGALVVTPVVSLAAMIFFPKAGWNNAVILSVPGFVVHVVVSLLTPPPTRSFAEVAAALTRERRNIEG